MPRSQHSAAATRGVCPGPRCACGCSWNSARLIEVFFSENEGPLDSCAHHTRQERRKSADPKTRPKRDQFKTTRTIEPTQPPATRTRTIVRAPPCSVDRKDHCATKLHARCLKSSSRCMRRQDEPRVDGTQAEAEPFKNKENAPGESRRRSRRPASLDAPRTRNRETSATSDSPR